MGPLDQSDPRPQCGHVLYPPPLLCGLVHVFKSRLIIIIFLVSHLTLYLYTTLCSLYSAGGTPSLSAMLYCREILL